MSSLQAEALRATVPRATLPGLQLRQSAATALASRAHLEASLATALALQSAAEYRRWLLAYARFLAERAEEGRLREVCDALLGSGVVVAAGSGGDEDAAMAEADAAAVEWQPTVLGLVKHDLLRDVLREMSRNRSLQRTTQIFLDSLSELERAAAAAAAVPSAGAAAVQ